MAFQASRARAHLDEGLGLLESLDSRSAACVSTFAGLYRATLDRIESRGFDVFDGSSRLSSADEAADHGRGAAAMRVAVVGGGLAGLSAALELVDGGHEVTVHEARPTLGGAVQTLPRREGDPEPPPDNGQHVALGCFTEYLRFLERVGESGSVRRVPLELPVLDEHGRSASISPSALALLRYRHVSARRAAADPARRSRAGATAAARPSRTLLRARGQSQRAIDRFWDVFIRPALNLRSEEASAEAGDFTVRTALLGERSDSDLLLPTRPLGEMHGDAAGRALEAAGATVLAERARRDLDELDADAVVVAVPPRESARLLGEPEPRARGLADRQRPPLVRPGAARARRWPRCSAATRTGSSTAAR